MPILLRKPVLMTVAAVLTVLVVSCSSDDDDAVIPAGPTTLKQFAVNDLDNRSTDTAVPIEINDLEIDDSADDPAQYDDVLQSS